MRSSVESAAELERYLKTEPFKIGSFPGWSHTVEEGERKGPATMWDRIGKRKSWNGKARQGSWDELGRGQKRRIAGPYWGMLECASGTLWALCRSFLPDKIVESGRRLPASRACTRLSTLKPENDRGERGQPRQAFFFVCIWLQLT